jgi:Mn2+/Fe2+ NRAMP family transporter
MSTGNVKEGWSAVGKGFFNPDLAGCVTTGGVSVVLLITLIMANIGTTITPWQIFFQQSAVVDKGMDIRDVKMGKIDTMAGALLTCIVAAFIVIACAGVFYYHPGDKIVIESAKDAAVAMPQVMTEGHWGQWAKTLFAIGLFDAGLLGALCISLSTSWALGEVFGWAHSLNKSVREAPWFYVGYVVMLGSAAVLSLVSTEWLQNWITIAVQVFAVTLLPVSLVFLILLLNDKDTMGEHANTRWQNIANWSIAIFVMVVSSLYGVYVLYQEQFTALLTSLFGGK